MPRIKGAKNKANRAEVEVKKVKTEFATAFFPNKAVEAMLVHNATKRNGYNPDTTTFESVEITSTKAGFLVTLNNPSFTKSDKVEKKPTAQNEAGANQGGSASA